MTVSQFADKFLNRDVEIDIFTIDPASADYLASFLTSIGIERGVLRREDCYHAILRLQAYGILLVSERSSNIITANFPDTENEGRLRLGWEEVIDIISDVEDALVTELLSVFN